MQDKAITIVLQGNPAFFPVLVTDEESETTGKSLAYSEIPGYVSAVADQYNINKIKVYGSNTYAEGVIEDLLYISKTQYSNNNLEIEVIQG